MFNGSQSIENEIGDIVYEVSLLEVLSVETEQLIAASNLENPEEGGEWGWD